ncbi:MAG: hypothetical protein ABFD16_22815 [Thermoguttaceae bacterium]
MTKLLSERTSRVGWRIWLWGALLFVIAASGIDYYRFHASTREALAVVFDLGGWAGSIGGWPFGEENRIVFRRALSDEEIQRLHVLNSLARSMRHHVVISFQDSLPADRLAAVQRILSDCHVRQPSNEHRE